MTGGSNVVVLVLNRVIPFNVMNVDESAFNY